MEMQQLQSAARAERKKDLYILSLDGGRVFWLVSIALLVLVFLFLLGYWIGHDTLPTGQTASLEQPLAQTQDGTVPRDMASLKRELERIGQPTLPDARSGSGLESGAGEKKELTPLDAAGINKPGAQATQESEKPRIDEESLPSKSEKREFETLRTKPKKQAKPATRTSTTTRPSTSRSTQPARAAAPAEAVSSGKYLVQVASLSSRSGAESLAKTLQAKRYQTSIVESTVQGKEFYRVRVGGYDSYDAAARVVANLKSSGDAKGSYIVQR